MTGFRIVYQYQMTQRTVKEVEMDDGSAEAGDRMDRQAV